MTHMMQSRDPLCVQTVCKTPKCMRHLGTLNLDMNPSSIGTVCYVCFGPLAAFAHRFRGDLEIDCVCDMTPYRSARDVHRDQLWELESLSWLYLTGSPAHVLLKCSCFNPGNALENTESSLDRPHCLHCDVFQTLVALSFELGETGWRVRNSCGRILQSFLYMYIYIHIIASNFKQRNTSKQVCWCSIAW